MISFATIIALSATSTPGDAQDPLREVRRHDVMFRSNDTRMVGHLYLPASYDGGKTLPGVVVTGAWTTVKEQMPATYAKQLAARGFAALTFDFRGWGGSGGEPRYLEDPERKTQDIVAAAAFLAGRTEVDPSRVGGLGVCASAGYMAEATRRSHDIRALGLVAPWLHDPAIAETVYGGADGVAKLVAVGREAAAADEPMVIEAASTTNEQALMFRVPYYTEADRGLVEEYDNRFNLAFWGPWLTYDALRIAESLRKPTVAVHSQAAVIPQGITRFVERMGAFARVEWLDDVSQFDFYDRTAPVTKAADVVAEHFRRVFRDQQDVAAVDTVLAGLMAMIDLRKFDAAETLYAPKVFVDYSSLSGEKAETRSADALLASWAALLPGFDRTHHVLSDVHVRIDGDRAKATARVKADHFVGTHFWQARGVYRFELTKRGRDWTIHSHALDLTGESGSRDVLVIAARRAADKANK